MIEYKFFMNDENGNIFITLEDEKYKDVLVKVGNIQLTPSQEIDFEIELQDKDKSFYDDKDFLEYISECVGDIIKKAVNSQWSEEANKVLQELESAVSKYFEKTNYKLPENQSFINLFGKKGYVISFEEDTDKLVATNIYNNKRYYFDLPEQFSYLKKEITGTGLIIT